MNTKILLFISAFSSGISAPLLAAETNIVGTWQCTSTTHVGNNGKVSTDIVQTYTAQNSASGQSKVQGSDVYTSNMKGLIINHSTGEIGKTENQNDVLVLPVTVNYQSESTYRIQNKTMYVTPVKYNITDVSMPPEFKKDSSTNNPYSEADEVVRKIILRDVNKSIRNKKEIAVTIDQLNSSNWRGRVVSNNITTQIECKKK